MLHSYRNIYVIICFAVIVEGDEDGLCGAQGHLGEHALRR